MMFEENGTDKIVVRNSISMNQAKLRIEANQSVM